MTQERTAAFDPVDAGSSLLVEIAAGSSAAFETFYDRYSAAVYGVLLKIAGDAEDANDLLQETFVQAWKSASRFDRSRGSEIAWLITIARSRALDRLRSRRSRSDRESSAGKEILAGASAVDVSGEVELREARRLILTAMEELPPEQRQVLELAYFEGKSHSEIASELGQPLGSVKTRIQLGMRKLRGRLAPMFRWKNVTTKI